MSDPELDELHDLLTGAGWARFYARYQEQWGEKGEQYLAAVNAAINRIDDQEQRRALERVRFAQKVMAEFMGWPEERVRILKMSKEQPRTRAEMNARLEAQDRELAGMPRRGGL